jgi:4'-phosphopantetheinyl transferase
MSDREDDDPFALAPDDIHVWLSWLDVPRERIKDLTAYLSPDELDRADRLRFEADRRRFVAARGILRELCCNHTGTPPEQVRFSADDHGKPRLADIPPGLDLRFNVSHSGAAAAYAFALGAEVGIDIEAPRPDFDDAQIEASMLPLDLIDQILAVPAARRQEAFLEEWTAREALAKATGLGMAHYLAGGVDPADEVGWQSWDLPKVRGYVGTLVMPAGKWYVSCRQWGA